MDEYNFKPRPNPLPAPPKCEPVEKYSPVPPFHDKPEMPMPPCGYIFPPLPPYCPGVSPEEQMGILTDKVNQLIKTLNDYTGDVYGAYNAVVNSALCNDAYYNEITVEEGYIAEASAPYKVVHIPFLDRAKQPIYFQLGLAYNNTTNANVHEDVFNASERTLADKLIPAYNSTNTWEGAVVWKGAPIGKIGENPAQYTFGVTRNGFFKIYENLTNYNQLTQDNVENAFMANSVLMQGGSITPDKFYPDEKDQLIGRVGVGMNYGTKERFIVIVQGSDSAGCTAEQLANIFAKYNCTLAVELANMNMTTALDKGAFMFTPPTTAGDVVPTIPEVNAFWYITKRRHYHNEYVRDVAMLTQKYGEMLWRSETANISVDDVKAVVATFQQQLDHETAEREAADTQLQGNIDKEVNDRQTADAALQTNIDNLSSHVDEVESALQQADEALANKDVVSVEKTSDNEKNIYRLRLKDSTYIDVAVETYDYSLLKQKLDTLSALEPRLDAEVTARQEADARIEAKADTNTSDIAELNTTKVNKAGDTMGGNLNMAGNTVTGLKDPVSDTDAVSLKYFNENKSDVSGQFLPTAGGSMGGNINMTGNKITNLGGATEATDAANKQYVDNQITTQVPTIIEGTVPNMINEEIAQQVPQIVADEIEKPDNPIVTELDKKFLPLAGGTLTGDVSMSGNHITDVEAPVNDTDVSNKAYVDSALAGVVGTPLRKLSDTDWAGITFTQAIADMQSYAGYQIAHTELATYENILFLQGETVDTNIHILARTEGGITEYIGTGEQFLAEHFTTYTVMTESPDGGGIDAGGNVIKDVGTPTEDTDAANKQYVDTAVDELGSQLNGLYLAKAGGVMTGSLELAADPTENLEAATKQYVDNKVSQAGGGDFMADGSIPMTGNLNMGNNKIVTVADPTEEYDGANKHYVDSATASAIAGAQFLPLAGGTLTGDVDMGTHLVKNVGQPTTGTDVANKTYVDDAILTVQQALDEAEATIETQATTISDLQSRLTTAESSITALNEFMNKYSAMLTTIYNG